MFDSKTILIADSSTYAAVDLAGAVEECEGRVAGPVTTLSEAVTILDSGSFGGAIVDCELVEASALIMWLAATGVPFVVQTSVPLPQGLDDLDRRLKVLMRPIDARTVVAALANEISEAGNPC
jgi:hypothetical protein